MSKTITFTKLKKLEFCNSKDLPQRVKIRDGKRWIFKEWVGIGWIDVEPLEVGESFRPEDVVEVIDG